MSSDSRWTTDNRRHNLFELKRKWLPLFFLGSAIFGAGIALGVLWFYRESPRWVTDAVVDFLTPGSPEAPPRGTLISATAAAFTLAGGSLLIFAVRRINASEVGEIDSFWWKVAVAALAGQWWLGQPRIVALAAGPDLPLLLRALKTFSNHITVLSSASPVLALALADDEAAVRKVLGVLTGDLDELADGLRLRGRFLPPAPTRVTLDAISRADALVCAPSLDSDGNFDLDAPDPVADAIRQMRGRKVLVGSVAASQADRLKAAVQGCTARFGAMDAILINSNSVQPLPPGRFYQKIENAVERDLVDWAAPEQWDVAKLAVFLREVVSKSGL